MGWKVNFDACGVGGVVMLVDAVREDGRFVLGG